MCMYASRDVHLTLSFGSLLQYRFVQFLTCTTCPMSIGRVLVSVSLVCLESSLVLPHHAEMLRDMQAIIASEHT